MNKVLQTLKLFTKQCRQAWEETQKLELPNYGGLKNICVCSMGASSFGYQVIKSLFPEDLRVPVLLNSDYNLPGFLNQDSLVFFSSYSGTTEEVISCFQEANKRKLKMLGITQENSPLGSFFTKNQKPFYKLVPTYNPAGQPRMGSGYMIAGLVGMLQKLKLLPDRTHEVLSSLDFVDNEQGNIQLLAEEMATKLFNRQIIIFASEHLAGNAHILRNQFNESSKNYSDYYLLPELNHHLLEGLSHPDTLTSDIIVLTFNSGIYSAKINLRLKLTNDIIKQNKLRLIEFDAKGNNKIEQVFYTASFSGFLSYYLALLHNEDPAKIPWVDYFKSKLSAHDQK